MDGTSDRRVSRVRNNVVPLEYYYLLDTTSRPLGESAGPPAGIKIERTGFHGNSSKRAARNACVCVRVGAEEASLVSDDLSVRFSPPNSCSVSQSVSSSVRGSVSVPSYFWRVSTRKMRGGLLLLLAARGDATPASAAIGS